MHHVCASGDFASGRGCGDGAGAAACRVGADYPSRPVHWSSVFAAGGPPDMTARLIGPWL